MPHSGLSGTNLKNASDHNLRVTLQAIRLYGPVSRAELARIIGLTPQAIAYISKKLMADGMVIEAGRRRGGRGQPATEIAINPDGGFSVGVNIDRDHLAVILLDLAGEVRGRARLERNFMLPDETFDWIEGAFHRLLGDSGVTRDSLLGVGLAIPYKLGYLRLAVTPEPFAAWRDYPAGERLEKITGFPVIEANDATAAAIGENQYGHGARIRNFFYVFLGYGLGGGLVVDGQYVPGDRGHGGEIGFIPQWNGSGVGPSNLQDRVSLATLYASLGKAGIAASDPGDLGRLFDAGSPAIGEWLDTAAENLLQTLVTIICAVNPGAILMGGRLPERMIDALIADLEKRIAPILETVPCAPPILRAACSTDAAALGAAIMPLSRMLFPMQDVLMKKAS